MLADSASSNGECARGDSQASCDETLNHLETLIILYPDINGFSELINEYNVLGKKINNYITWVEDNWNV